MGGDGLLLFEWLDCGLLLLEVLGVGGGLQTLKFIDFRWGGVCHLNVLGEKWGSGWRLGLLGICALLHTVYTRSMYTYNLSHEGVGPLCFSMGESQFKSFIP